MVMLQKFLDYFVNPLKTGYDFSKTLTFAIIFVIGIYLIFLFLKKLKIKVDEKFAIAIFPYILFGATLRVLRDLEFFTSNWLVTPGIYFLVTFLVSLILLISLILQKKLKIPYFKTLFLIGILLFSFSLSQIKFSNLNGALLVIIFFLPFVIFFYFFKKWSLENRLVTLTQIFDGTVTAIAMRFFGYGEQHILPNIFINIFGPFLFGPFSFLILKMVMIICALILIDKLYADREFKNYLKLVISILGLGTGTRDFICLLSLCMP